MHTIDRSIQSSSSSDNQQSDPELRDMKSFCFFIPFLHLRRIAPALSSPGQARFYLGLLHFLASPLLLFFLASGLAAKDPLRLAMYICLVLESYAAEMAQDVLHLGVGVTARSAAEVVNP